MIELCYHYKKLAHYRQQIITANVFVGNSQTQMIISGDMLELPLLFAK